MRHTFATVAALLATFSIAFSGALPVRAETLQCVGVMGNSGEQGATLVRFQGPTASGIGVVYDRFGTLWDRGGMQTLNRYAPDGRQIGTYPLPKNAPNQGDGKSDVIALSGDTLILKLGTGLFTLPVGAPSGTAPVPLDGAPKVDRMSLSTWQGWVAVISGSDVILLNAAGEKKTLSTLAEPKYFHVEIGPDGTVYVQISHQLIRRIAQDGSATDIVAGMPGDRAQLIDGWWYGHVWHGTIRRSDLAFQPSPGVVLGGNSGSFLGHVAENSDLTKGQGMVHMGTGNLFAVSGHQGILQLLEWKPADKRFDVIRRIGSVTSCAGIGLDRTGRIWHSTGIWEWNDGPATPLLFGVPPGESAPVITMLEGDGMLGYQQMWGATTFRYGTLDKEVRSNRLEKSKLPRDVVAVAVTKYQQKNVALLLQKDGTCTAVYISPDGNPSAEAGPVTLKTVSPVAKYTSLVALNKDTLLAGGDGAVIEFVRDGDSNWTESKRWQFWGDRPEDKLGDPITVTADSGRIWISDTSRQRILCFDASAANVTATSAPKLLAAFGRTDTSGDDLSSLNQPGTIAARGDRAVVFDSANQRLLKFELKK